MRSSFAVIASLTLLAGCRRVPETPVTTDLEKQGRQIFRYDTFGDERFWTDTAWWASKSIRKAA